MQQTAVIHEKMCIHEYTKVIIMMKAFVDIVYLFTVQ